MEDKKNFKNYQGKTHPVKDIHGLKSSQVHQAEEKITSYLAERMEFTFFTNNRLQGFFYFFGLWSRRTVVCPQCLYNSLSAYKDPIPKGKCKNLLPVSHSEGESFFQMLHESPQLFSK